MLLVVLACLLELISSTKFCIGKKTYESSSPHWGTLDDSSLGELEETTWFSHATSIEVKKGKEEYLKTAVEQCHADPNAPSWIGLERQDLSWETNEDYQECEQLKDEKLKEDPALPLNTLGAWTGFRYYHADDPQHDGDLTENSEKNLAKTKDAALKKQLNLRSPAPLGTYFLVHGPALDGFSNYPRGGNGRYWRIRKHVSEFNVQNLHYYLVCGTGGFPGQVHILAVHPDDATTLEWAKAKDNNLHKIDISTSKLLRVAGGHVSAPKTYKNKEKESKPIDINIFYVDRSKDEEEWAFSGHERYDFIDTDKSKKLLETHEVVKKKLKFEPLQPDQL